MLTNEGDAVLDPFAGECVPAKSANAYAGNGRASRCARSICAVLLAGSERPRKPEQESMFEETGVSTSYKLNHPGALWNGHEEPPRTGRRKEAKDMPAIRPEQLVAAISNAIIDSGYTSNPVSSVHRNPRRFLVTGPHVNFTQAPTVEHLRLAEPALPNEIRIQMTGVEWPLELPAGGPTVLIGYEPELNLFAGFDLDLHRKFSGRFAFGPDR